MSDHQAELEALLNAEPTPTRRPTVPEMESQLYTIFPILDHGFVRVIDYMGDDSAICQAARVSYGKGTKSVNNDRGLIRYLMRHRHTTPFEMCEIKLHVKLPIFIARQWIRHRTANVNEYSARYSILDREFYLPNPQDIAVQSSTNRQGRGDVLTAEQSAHVLDLLRRDSMQAYETYETIVETISDDPRGLQIQMDSLYNLGAINLQWNRPELAEKQLARVVLTVPGHRFAHYARGQALLELGRHEEAQQELQTHLRVLHASGEGM